MDLHSTATKGFQYTSTAYFNLTKEYEITPSMSRRGNCLDNACVETFFGTLKAECIYRNKPNTHYEARAMIDEYIQFYNYDRIQLKTRLTPHEKRCQSA
ncbi:IS3 family transposase [Desulfitobacterium dehalogenans]|uniref:IS3 family transposase n=1 Tax=Desulfitobacterium dehalogenans TaxID=36854 RepID=UPI001A99FB5C